MFENNHLLKKYWKTWVLLSFIILIVYLLNLFIFDSRIVDFVVIALILMLPLAFFLYVSVKEKQEK